MKGIVNCGSAKKGKPGINFSMLARNASKFYGTKVIGIENTSPEVSPAR